MKAVLFIILGLTVSTFSQSPPLQPRTHTVRGTIKDPSGGVISGLWVRQADNSRFSSVTDENGEFKIELPVGEHVLIVDPFEVYGFRAFIKIVDGAVNPDNVEFVVDPSPVCCTTKAGEAFPKPTSLPRPAYPAAARAIRARGEVIVLINIGRDGKVTSAKAQNGHPLLRAAAEGAARGSRFESSENEAREARLTYIFIPSVDKPREGLVQYSNPYRIEVVGISLHGP